MFKPTNTDKKLSVSSADRVRLRQRLPFWPPPYLNAFILSNRRFWSLSEGVFLIMSSRRCLFRDRFSQPSFLHENTVKLRKTKTYFCYGFIHAKIYKSITPCITFCFFSSFRGRGCEAMPLRPCSSGIQGEHQKTSLQKRRNSHVTHNRWLEGGGGRRLVRRACRIASIVCWTVRRKDDVSRTSCTRRRGML